MPRKSPWAAHATNTLATSNPFGKNQLFLWERVLIILSMYLPLKFPCFKTAAHAKRHGMVQACYKHRSDPRCYIQCGHKNRRGRLLSILKDLEAGV
jgi:hypothetical protein